MFFLTEMMLTIPIIGYVTSYGLVDIYWHFGGTYYLHLQDGRKAVCSSVIWVNIYQTTWYHLPGGSNHHSLCKTTSNLAVLMLYLMYRLVCKQVIRNRHYLFFYITIIMCVISYHVITKSD
jgi:hypothetical protein